MAPVWVKYCDAISEGDLLRLNGRHEWCLDGFALKILHFMAVDKDEADA